MVVPYKKSALSPCMELFCLCLITSWICWINCRNWLKAVGLTPIVSLEPLFNCLKVALHFSFVGITLEDNHLNCLNWLLFPMFVGGLLHVTVLGYMALLSLFLDFWSTLVNSIVII